MVRLSAVFGILLTMAVGTQASFYCQCLYQDGSHCCVAENNGGCTRSCLNVAPLFENDKPCNAGGKSSDVSFFTAQGRHACND
ncbi:hypothetical protein BKA58DRAFT_132338 [Alternaria rosae]|uniref:uncharacterized protein n=1 Tax=Alternaria rosae TaxID=1187941 RepID=UPI001E8D1B1D|nr:uncharacterized protein BKA58DRAFT_132338 [Alternaria rosae]KAH6875962.1 hypothetical protein BKA58DRAFT_132338 [Alternaria rosae]